LVFSGESNPGPIKKISRFIRGNFFIPDARIGWISPAVRAASRLLRSESFDCIITSGPPHSAHIIGLKLKKKFGIRWIADFRDPWTELYYNRMLYRTGAAKKFDHHLESKVLHAADRILTVGPSMKELLQQKLEDQPSKVDYIYNGFDASAFTEMKRSRTDDAFVICHLGILSDNQPITGFLRAMKLVHEMDKKAFEKMVLRIIGKVSPAILEEIRATAPFLKTEIKEYIPHQEALQHILDADLLFNSLAATEQGKYLISGKLMEYLASGNPILCLGEPDGDAAKLLSEFPDAKVFDRKDETGMSDFILKIFRNHGNKQHLQNTPAVMRFSREQTARDLASLIENLTASNH
jgi:glycosyltransferase involved in cell wall biosynthesis